MNDINKTKWIESPVMIFLTITIPQLILFGIFYDIFLIIKTMLHNVSMNHWMTFGAILLSFLTAYTLYAIVVLKKKSSIHPLISPAIFLTYIPFLYFFCMHINILFPGRIPSWMVADETFMYPGTFIMPAFIYALITAIRWLTPDGKKKKPVINFLMAALIPLSWYGFFELIVPMHRNVSGDIWIHFFIIAIIGSTVLFLFFLLRGVYILLSKQAERSKKHESLLRLFVTLILPLFSLLLYNGFFKIWHAPVYIFGDFSHPLFFVFACLTGILLTLPDSADTKLRLIMFAGRNFTVPVTFYFFLIFLPWTPLSIIAIVFFGIGILMLVPLVLMVVHSKIITRDFRFLREHVSKTRLIAISTICFLILPAGITINFYLDRQVIHQALDYVYQPDYRGTSAKGLSLNRMERTLNTLDTHKTRGRLWDKKIPLITSYYNWLVLDNLTLSDSKINLLKRIFFNAPAQYQNQPGVQPAESQVVITDIESETRYDRQEQCYHSRILLDLTNGKQRAGEYVGTITLPEGTWVSDYYLWVGDKKEHGRLVEKKSALWIYQQIRNVRKDPGLIYYQKGNRITLKVFPFNPDEIRKTGFELLHKEPINLNIDTHSLSLTTTDTREILNNSFITKSNNAVYISSGLKAQLPEIKRTPYFHFILDFSRGTEPAQEEYIRQIQHFISQQSFNVQKTKITFANFYAETHTWNDEWQSRAKNFPTQGGFYLDRVLKTILINNFNETTTDYPVIVILTPGYNKAVISDDFADLSFTFPESDFIYELSNSGSLVVHSLTNASLSRVVNKAALYFPEYTVRVWPDKQNPIAFLRNDKQPGIVLISKDTLSDIPSSLPKGKWLSGLTQHGFWLSGMISPRFSDKTWPKLVKLSEETGILNRFTAYTVLETQSQWEVLKRKEKEALAGKHSLDVSENTQEMSEPPIILLIICMGIMLTLFMKMKKRFAGRAYRHLHINCHGNKA